MSNSVFLIQRLYLSVQFLLLPKQQCLHNGGFFRRKNFCKPVMQYLPESIQFFPQKAVLLPCGQNLCLPYSTANTLGRIVCLRIKFSRIGRGRKQSKSPFQNDLLPDLKGFLFFGYSTCSDHCRFHIFQFTL